MADDKKNSAPNMSNVAKPRLEMNAMMDQIQRIAEQKDLSAEDLENYFVGKHMDEIAEEAEQLTLTPEQKAQDLIYQSYDADSSKKVI